MINFQLQIIAGKCRLCSITLPYKGVNVILTLGVIDVRLNLITNYNKMITCVSIWK
jgi:hypothetical protein